MMDSGSKCGPWGWLVLLVGVLLMLQDLGLWNVWGLHWYTLAFLLAGLCKVMKN